MGIGDWGLGIGDWGLGIGSYLQYREIYKVKMAENLYSEKSLLRLRRVTYEDEELLLRWANDPATRASILRLFLSIVIS